MSSTIPRRDFLIGSATAMAWMAMDGISAGQAPNADGGLYSFCAFTKFLQSLEFDELAAAVAGAGFRGVEAPVRRGGHFSMEQAPEMLPGFVAALAKQNVKVTILCTDVLAADTPHAVACLRAAKDSGITCYRMGFHSYDLAKPVLMQLANIRAAMKDLAAMNRELGMQAVYQNHSGAEYVGATVWDMYNQIADLSPREVALAFDIRHATVEAGTAWPALFNAVQEHIGAVFVKDFEWRGRTAEHVPLGKGRVDPEFFQLLADSKFSGPVSVHVEYLEDHDAATNLEAIRRDYEQLKRWLPEA